MRKSIISRLFILLFMFFITGNIKAQESDTASDSLRKSAVRLFIDCQRCDINYIRKEIPYVNYVRDVREAQVYVLVTRQSTGSGGSEYTFSFLGQEEFEGMNDTLIYASRPDDTRDHTREGRTQMLRMGLMRYVAKTPIFEEVQISHKGRSVPEEVTDKWNYWVFELETRPRFELEESRKEIDIDNSISAVKITPEWKIEMDFNHNFTRTKYNFEDTTYIEDKSSKSLRNLIVKSLSEHWSIGARFDISSSTFQNTKLNYDFFPSIEYNIFPYSESTHRQLRFLYGLGYSYNEYYDTTIFDKITDKLLKHQLQIAYQVQEKWGSINISLEGSNYFNDFKKNRLELEGFINIRIVKGLSFNIRGNVARIRDQLSLVKGEVSEADILLELQELATGYSIDGGIGFTYTFGSIYNNIVNPRFGSGRGFRRFF
ncbi:MAG: hypothetical protein KAU83_12855 [Bacteroidales bacterium]|nr:hypothetical protein [Bacteroidales bacterium]